MYSTSQNEFVPVLIPEWNSLLVRNCVPILWCHPDPIRGVAILSRPAYNLPWEQWEKLKLTVSLFFCTRISQFLRKHGVTYRNYIPVLCKHLNTFLVHFFSRERIRQYIYCCAVDSKMYWPFFPRMLVGCFRWCISYQRYHRNFLWYGSLRVNVRVHLHVFDLFNDLEISMTS